MDKQDLRVLIIGSGGREHALVKAALASPCVAAVAAAPGNGGMQLDCTCFAIDVANHAAVREQARSWEADLVVIGPEAPLAAGLADDLRAAGFAVYGPGADGARLEASKAFCKDFLVRHGIPTADYRSFTQVSEAHAWLDQVGAPVVVKASGLAAGKGVIMAETLEQAKLAVSDMLEGQAFGESGSQVVIESWLTGEEASIMVVVSGRKHVCLPASQDHKRIGEADTGPNTGGMGAYAPADVVTPALQAEIVSKLIEPTLAGLEKEGMDYRGTLYIGVMLTPDGPKVLEFNVRFGDPECQVLFPLLASDPMALLYQAATGDLRPESVQFKDGYAAVVVVAAEGYPGDYAKGDRIGLPVQLPEGSDIIHAGTVLSDEGEILSNGGRVLGVTGQAATLQGALDQAYRVCHQIQWAQKYFRRDIGHRQLKRSS